MDHVVEEWTSPRVDHVVEEWTSPRIDHVVEDWMSLLGFSLGDPTLVMWNVPMNFYGVCGQQPTGAF
jgi:hypothetical protein